MRRAIVVGAVLTALTLAGCGGEEPATDPAASPAAPAEDGVGGRAPMKNPPSPEKWVEIAYKGNDWLKHVESARWKGETLEVATDYGTGEKDREQAGYACVAFRAYELFVVRGTDVKVVGSGGDQIATC